MLKNKHQQLFDILKEEFLRGDYPYGEKLPRMTVLAEKYSVSINIASKAVELLKQAGMVEAKVGDGIYSTFRVSESINRFHCAGNRLYGQYRGAKTLRILIEDYNEYQIALWNNFLQRFSSENPDVEIDANYHAWDYSKEPKPYEIVIGGYPFLQQMIPAGDQGLSDEWVRSFYPDLYEECIIKNNVHPGFLPYGFSTQLLLAADDTPAPEPHENILDYLERLPQSKPGFLMRSSQLLLAHMGIDMSKIGTPAFSEADAKKMLSVFERAKKLYASERLLWPHGKIVDREQMYDLVKKKRIQAMGLPSNMTWHIPANSGVQLLPYPHGEKPCIAVHYVHVSEKTLFPEECLRLLKALLSPAVQQEAENRHLFYAIQKEISTPETELLKKAIEKGEVQTPYSNTQIQADAFYNFLGWEFYYFLTGSRGPEVVELINRKVRYYYERVGARKTEN